MPPPVQKHRIIAAIKRAGPDGISRDDLYDMIYGNGLPPLPDKTVLKAHVWQLRNQFKLPIKGRRGGPGKRREGGYIWGG